MNNLKLYIIVFISVLFGRSLTAQQLNFKTEVDTTTIALNQSFDVSFVINKDYGDFTPPDFIDFEIIKGQSKSINNSWIAGKRSFEKKLTYRIKPKKKGKLIIGSAKYQLDGQTYYTKPLEIMVKRKQKYSKPSQFSKSKFADSVYVQAILSKNSISKKDSIKLDFRILVAKSVGLNKYKIVKKPNFKRFNKTDVSPKKFEIKHLEINGKAYRYVIINSFWLKPLKTGSIKIQPLTIEVEIDIPDMTKKDIFGRNLKINKNIELSTKQLIVEVK